MRLAYKQRGIGMWGWLVILGMVGTYVMVGLALTPLYLNELKVVKVVQAGANDSSNATAAIPDVRRALQLRWDVEDIDYIKPADVKVAPAPGGGRVFSYDYEARVPLVYNVSLLVHFQHKFNVKGSGGGD